MAGHDDGLRRILARGSAVVALRQQTNQPERLGGAPQTRQHANDAAANQLRQHRRWIRRSTPRRHLRHLPQATNHPTPANGLRRPRIYYFQNILPTSHRLHIVPPQRRVTTRPAQWERGFVAPGAQSPTTSTHRVERGRECGGSTSKGGGASLMDEDGGDGVRLLPLPESSWPANDAQC